MKNRNLTYDAKYIHLAAAVSSGTDASMVATAEIDMKGYDSISFIVNGNAVASAGALTTLRIKNYATSGSPGSGTVNAIGSDLVATDLSGKFMTREVHKPQERYIRLYYQRTVQNSSLHGIIAILHNRRNAWIKEDLDTDATSGIQEWDVQSEPVPSTT